uniref:Reverse transcriptase domain-containing protein n=1 Tax=Lactuca sativa TaxID=4236 RepID=A0A9R1W0S5_LACSA|nr:hypothetical protein LSAT_V11C300125010 [Lactuca sativa]
MERFMTCDIKQRAKIKWVIDGDENSSFFHGFVNNKKRKNRIAGLLIDNQWITNPETIKSEIFSFYKKKFRERWPTRPKFLNSRFSVLDPLASSSLEAPFTIEEIKEAIWTCGSEKSSGPDGLSFKFIKRNWEIMKHDIVNGVKYFESYGVISRGCNASFITLVPKKKDPLTIEDYRPISVIGSMYKIISKILSIRLKRVIGECIGNVQSTFIEGRNILEGLLIINEMYSWAKKSKEKMLLFKSCLKTATLSVLVNGSPTKEFGMGRGIRQGDPLSPFLFLIAMEGLNIVMKEACAKGIFKGTRIPNSNLIISHLFYADDALFIGEWSKENINNLARILRCFHVSSGLKVNFNKSRIFGIGVDKQEVTSLVEPLGCKPSDLPLTYLSVPVGANMKYKKHSAPVIERFQSRLNLWKSKTLSLGGRLTLVKAVLGSLPTFSFSLFVAPTGVIKKLESIRRRFLWGGAEEQKKINWVSWKSVTAPKEIGGLGLGSLKALNLSLITKWIWRLKVDSSGLWSKVIKGIHNLYNKPAQYISKKTLPGIWNRIAGVQVELKLFDIDMEEIMMKKIGSGEETMFWLDRWIGDSTLKTSFPEAYNLERNKHCKISDRLQNGIINWEWKSAPRTPELVSEINMLASRIRDFQTVQGNDKWVCTLSSDGIFHVDRLRIQIDRWNLPTLETPLKWIHEIPLKVTCFMWRANLERIPTACALLKGGIQLTSPICSYCENAEEDASHVLFRCPMAAKVWEWVLSWCDLLNVHFESVEELLKFTAHWGTCEKKRRSLISIGYGTTWLIWKARCDWVFKKTKTSPAKVADLVKSTVFLWIKYRREYCNLQCIEWCINPFICM